MYGHLYKFHLNWLLVMPDGVSVCRNSFYIVWRRIQDVNGWTQCSVPTKQQNGDKNEDQDDGHVHDDQEGHGGNGPRAHRWRICAIGFIAVEVESAILEKKWILILFLNP